jgi:phospholipase C
MKLLVRCGYALIVGAAVALLPGCGGELAWRGLPPAGPAGRWTAHHSPIAHVVVIVQENRTFNNFFATFPGADGTTTGKVIADSKCRIDQDKTVKLKVVGLVNQQDFNHYFQAYHTARDGGRMDGFDTIRYKDDTNACMAPYQYVNPSLVRPYWDMAKQYVLAERMFTSQGSGGFTNHQDLITDGTLIEPGQSMVNFPTCSGGHCHWGCDAPPNTHTSLIGIHDVLQLGKGPYPCSRDFPMKYPTIRDLLDARGLSWKYYLPAPCCSTNGRLFDAFDVIYPVRRGPEWKTNISSPETNIFADISLSSLPAVSWVIPDTDNSDHPSAKVDNGPAWVASIVNAIGRSRYWDSTAIVVVWDDWGGLYDNLDPPQHPYGGLGFRVPGLIISPYAKAGYISTTEYQFASILHYIEQNWGLGYLGHGDRDANSIIDCFDYSQPPRAFTPIHAEHDESYFLHRRPSGFSIDDD